jgi:hypothetical protein
MLERFKKMLSGARSATAAEDYVRMAYRVLLHREIDPAGLEAWRREIGFGRFDEQNVVAALLACEEYQVNFGINLVEIVHRSRQDWIATVPAYGRILDIGGSNPSRTDGSLIALGYPHRPRVLDIVDLPPDDQYFGKPSFDQSVTHRFAWGEVNYYHARAERIHEVAGLSGKSYDCVFMGQAIEHIFPEALPSVLAWIRAHLAPDGRFVFDTPNRLLTKIQCPHSLINPDHKYEYEPTEMERVLTDAGFEITRRVGMVHLPRQAANGKYDPREFVGSTALSDDVDGCYLVAFEAKVA